jgi:hypothetical protein
MSGFFNPVWWTGGSFAVVIANRLSAPLNGTIRCSASEKSKAY